jgi:pimeloyl-ACP methyl ester carboxylesterase
LTEYTSLFLSALVKRSQTTFHTASKQVRCPITLIVADQEPTNEAMKAFMRMRKQGIAHIKELRPNARIVIMPDTIHDIPLQHPEELSEEIIQRSVTPCLCDKGLGPGLHRNSA